MLLIVLAGAVGAYYYYFYQAEPAGQDTSLFVSGTIEVREVEAAFNQAGLVEAVLVDEGDQVSQGQVLARLDSRRLRESLAEAEAAHDAAEAQISLLTVTLKQAEQAAQARLALARARFQAAKAALDQAQAGQTRAEVELARAAKEWRRIRPLFIQGSATARQRDEAEAAHETAQSGRRAAEAALAQARANLAQAEADQALAQAEALEPERIRRQIDLAHAQASQAEARVALLRQTLNEMTLFAPVTGRVLSRNIEPGEVVSPGTGVVTLADLEHVWLRAYVPEPHLGRVKLGQTVNVTVDFFAHRNFIGRVSYISDQAEFTPKAVQTKDERVKLVFRIKVDLENPDQALKPGMPADGRISLKGP